MSQFRRLGVDIRRYDSNQSTELRRLLMMRNAAVNAVLDVGANVGEYAGKLREAGFGGTIVSFEPLKEVFAQLKNRSEGDPLWFCLNVALGDENTEKEIFVSGNSYSSSFLPMGKVHRSAASGSGYVGSETVQIRRLDDIKDRWWPESGPFLLKIDTQGYELNVLKGALASLKNIALVEMELTLVTLYEGQPLFREALDYLAVLGFELISLQPGFSNPHTGHLLQMDGIFAKS